MHADVRLNAQLVLKPLTVFRIHTRVDAYITTLIKLKVSHAADSRAAAVYSSTLEMMTR